MHLIDEQPKEAVAALLRIIAYHDRLARRDEVKDLEESWRYHEASRKDAEERLALYGKRWREDAAVGKSDPPAATAEAGNCPNPGTAAVIGERGKGMVSPREGLQPFHCKVGLPPFLERWNLTLTVRAPDPDGRHPKKVDLSRA